MCRAIYPYELGDPDFAWLLATFQESHPGYVLIDSTCLPLVLVDGHKDQAADTPVPTEVPKFETAEDLEEESAEK